MRRAALDIGSNSILLLIADVDGRQITPVREAVWYPRLGRGLAASGSLSHESMEAAEGYLRDALLLCLDYKVEDVKAGATAAVREAKNGEEFAERTNNRLGLEIRILSGEEEAELTYLGGVSHLPHIDEPRAVLDVGGGSSECSYGHGERLEAAHSVPIGVVKLTDQFGRSPSTSPVAMDLVRESLAPLVADARGHRLIGVGGSITTLASVKLKLAEYDTEAIASVSFTAAELQGMVRTFSALSTEELGTLPGMDPRRADIIEAGATLYAAFMEMADCSEIAVSPRGLRFGLLLHN